MICFLGSNIIYCEKPVQHIHKKWDFPQVFFRLSHSGYPTKVNCVTLFRFFFLKKKAEFIVDSFFVVFTSKFGARKHFKWLFSLSNISQEILRTVSRRLMKLTTCGYFTIQSTSNSVSPLFMRRLNHMNCKVQNSLWTNLYSIENSVSIMWFFDRTWLSYWPRSGM